jgi:hypothetical protein
LSCKSAILARYPGKSNFMKLLFTSLICVTLFMLQAKAQDNNTVLNNFVSKTAAAQRALPIEKVYLHFDKPYYAVGDTIWFKAYVTVDEHIPSPYSRVIYVNILAPGDSVVQTLMLQAKNSVAWGNIPLGQFSYKKGNYRIVAFTNYMNNTGVSYFFNKNITIGDAINNQLITQVTLKSTMGTKYAKITAGIYFKDNDGNPYAGKKVNWSINKDDESVIKGKAETDKNGFVDINFINVKNISLDSANLATEIDNGPRKQVTTTFSLRPVAKPNDIQFFPEGGQLIVSVRTKIAFKAQKPDGLGIEVKGTITDNNNNVVSEFSSSHLGMGVFVLTPEDGKTYTAHVTYADGTAGTPEFPKVGADGINLALENNNPDSLTLKLQCDQAFLADFKGKTFFIIAKSSGNVYYAAKTTLQNLVYNATIPKTKFPTGVLQVTLFTDDGEPVSERVAFIQRNDQLNIGIKSDHPSYDTRQKVTLSLAVKTAAAAPDEGNFSVAVIDESKVPFDENAETTILTDLLLTGDIRGYVEKPNYYFNHPDQKAMTDLDILLQTQGYRRYSYDNVLNNKQTRMSFGVERGIDIAGTLRGVNGIPVNRGNVHIAIPDKNFSADAVTDADGRFKFSNLVFSDSAKVTVSGRNNVHSSDLVISIDNGERQGLPPNFQLADGITNIDSTLNTYLKNSKQQYSDLHILKEVVIKDTRIENKPSHADYPGLASLGAIPDHLIKGAQFEGCNNLEDCLTGLAAGLTRDNDKFYNFQQYEQGNRTPLQIFLKGMPIETQDLGTIDPSSIESVEIFLKDQLGLVNSAYQSNGAIVINLKKGIEGKKISYQDLKDLLGTRYEVTMNPKGYEPIKIFYLPRYIGPRQSQPNQLDLRSTVYWNPNVNTDKTGSATLEYFSPDSQGTYRVTVEGFDKDGNLGRAVYRYTVK